MRVKKAMQVVKQLEQAAAPAAPVAPIVAAKQAKAKAVNARLARTITVLAASNPKKVNSKAFARFALYRTGATVAAYIQAGGKIGDLAYDVKHGFISLT